MIDHFRGVQKMAPSDFDALIGQVEPIKPPRHPHGDTMTTERELIQRLLLLAEQAVKEALDFEYEDPEDRHIWRELQELKQLVEKHGCR